jgi:hypothetical protein
MLEDLRSRGAHFIMVIVQLLNGFAAVAGCVVLGLHEMYPGAVADLTATLTPTQKMIGLAVWSGLVHFFLRQAKRTV